MTFSIPNMMFALPEMVMLTLACVLLLAIAYVDKYKAGSGGQVGYWLTQATLLVTGGVVYANLYSGSGMTFDGSYIKDGMSDILKLSICAVNILVLAYGRAYLKARGLYNGAYYILALFATLGMLIMVSAHHFLTLYLGLELLSLCLYALVAMHRNNKIATEAAMKYFILGALASGMLLYGMSIIYGVTGSLALPEIAAAISGGQIDSIALHFGVVFIVVAVAFKLGAVPFHMWLPDVYDGAPTAMTIFIATAPKIAGFALLMRLLVDGLAGAQPYWEELLSILAILSLVIGNIVAIAQTNLKRMLAYSTISHIGFILLGVLTGTAAGYSAAMFYVLLYVLTTAAGFGLILLMSRAGFEADQISDYQGLGRRQPWIALLLLLVMFSMAGVPPLVGFFAKLAVIQAVVDAGLMGLAVVAVLMSVVGAFYYLRIIKVLYFDAPASDKPEPVMTTDVTTRGLLYINVLALLGLGFFPSALLALCIRIFS